MESAGFGIAICEPGDFDNENRWLPAEVLVSGFAVSSTGRGAAGC